MSERVCVKSLTRGAAGREAQPLISRLGFTGTQTSGTISGVTSLPCLRGVLTVCVCMHVCRRIPYSTLEQFDSHHLLKMSAISYSAMDLNLIMKTFIILMRMSLACTRA